MRINIISIIVLLSGSLYAGMNDPQGGSGVNYPKPYGLNFGNVKQIEFNKKGATKDKGSATAGISYNSVFMKQVKSLSLSELSNKLETSKKAALENMDDQNMAKEYIILSLESERRAELFKRKIKVAGSQVLKELKAEEMNINEAIKKVIIAVIIDFSSLDQEYQSRQVEASIRTLHERGWTYHIIYKRQGDKFALANDIVKNAYNITSDPLGSFTGDLGVFNTPAAVAYMPDNGYYHSLFEGSMSADEIERLLLEFYKNVKSGIKYPSLKK